MSFVPTYCLSVFSSINVAILNAQYYAIFATVVLSNAYSYLTSLTAAQCRTDPDTYSVTESAS